MSETRLPHRNLWSAIAAVLVALVVYLSLTSDPIDVGGPDEVKLGHVFAYLVLMLWFAQLVRPWGARWAVGVGLVCMGVGLEYIQRMTGYRTFSYSDMRDNGIGVAIGIALAATPMGSALNHVETWLSRAKMR